MRYQRVTKFFHLLLEATKVCLPVSFYYFCERSAVFICNAPYLFGVVVGHAGGVVDGQHDLVLALGRLGAPQPDLVLAELRCDVRDHLAHVQPLPGAVVASVTIIIMDVMIIVVFIIITIIRDESLLQRYKRKYNEKQAHAHLRSA